jgi:hypothetical protein
MVQPGDFFWFWPVLACAFRCPPKKIKTKVPEPNRAPIFKLVELQFVQKWGLQGIPVRRKESGAALFGPPFGLSESDGQSQQQKIDGARVKKAKTQSIQLIRLQKNRRGVTGSHSEATRGTNRREKRPTVSPW